MLLHAGKSGLEGTRKHVEGNFINPEAKMARLYPSSQQGILTNPDDIKRIQEALEKQDWAATIGRSQVKPYKTPQKDAELDIPDVKSLYDDIEKTFEFVSDEDKEFMKQEPSKSSSYQFASDGNGEFSMQIIGKDTAPILADGATENSSEVSDVVKNAINDEDNIHSILVKENSGDSFFVLNNNNKLKCYVAKEGGQYTQMGDAKEIQNEDEFKEFSIGLIDSLQGCITDFIINSK